MVQLERNRIAKVTQTVYDRLLAIVLKELKFDESMDPPFQMIKSFSLGPQSTT